MPTKHVFGWKRDLPHPLDYRYAAPAHRLRALPIRVDLRDECPPIYDQLACGSCTANALGAAHQFDQIKQGQKDFVPSRLFIYYQERSLERTISEDAGAMIRDGAKVLAQFGAPPESTWPYDVARFATKPTTQAYVEALPHRVTSYARVSQNLQQMKGCLADGCPFVFGFSVFDSFESDEVARTGIVPMPKPTSEEFLGGHAVLCVGYDDVTGRFIVRNSWGEGWGDKGYFTMPYAYLSDSDLSSDLWTLSRIQ